MITNVPLLLCCLLLLVPAARNFEVYEHTPAGRRFVGEGKKLELVKANRRGSWLMLVSCNSCGGSNAPSSGVAYRFAHPNR